MEEKNRLISFGTHVEFDHQPTYEEIKVGIEKEMQKGKDHIHSMDWSQKRFLPTVIFHDGEVYNGIVTLPWTIAVRFDEVS